MPEDLPDTEAWDPADRVKPEDLYPAPKPKPKPERTRCRGTNRRGVQCSRYTTRNPSYCWEHK